MATLVAPTFSGTSVSANALRARAVAQPASEQIDPPALKFGLQAVDKAGNSTPSTARSMSSAAASGSTSGVSSGVTSRPVVRRMRSHGSSQKPLAGIAQLVINAGLKHSIRMSQLETVAAALLSNGFDTREALEDLPDVTALSLGAPLGLAAVIREEARGPSPWTKFGPVSKIDDVEPRPEAVAEKRDAEDFNWRLRSYTPTARPRTSKSGAPRPKSARGASAAMRHRDRMSTGRDTRHQELHTLRVSAFRRDVQHDAWMESTFNRRNVRPVMSTARCRSIAGFELPQYSRELTNDVALTVPDKPEDDRRSTSCGRRRAATRSQSPPSCATSRESSSRRASAGKDVRLTSPRPQRSPRAECLAQDVRLTSPHPQPLPLAMSPPQVLLDYLQEGYRDQLVEEDACSEHVGLLDAGEPEDSCRRSRDQLSQAGPMSEDMHGVPAHDPTPEDVSKQLRSFAERVLALERRGSSPRPKSRRAGGMRTRQSRDDNTGSRWRERMRWQISQSKSPTRRSLSPEDCTFQS